jgi:hypothetical protein
LAEKTTQTLGYPQKSSVKILPKYARASGTTLVHQLHNPDFFLKFPEPMWLLPRMAAELGNSESTNIPCNSVCIYLSIYLSIYIYSIIYTYTDIGSPLQMDHATCFFWAKARNSMFFICVLLRAFTALSPHEHHVGEEKNGQKKRLHSLS